MELFKYSQIKVSCSTYFMKFSWVTFPVVKYLIPYTDTIPMFSMARSRFLKEMRYLKSNIFNIRMKHNLKEKYYSIAKRKEKTLI